MNYVLIIWVYGANLLALQYANQPECERARTTYLKQMQTAADLNTQAVCIPGVR